MPAKSHFFQFCIVSEYIENENKQKNKNYVRSMIGLIKAKLYI